MVLIRPFLLILLALGIVLSAPGAAHKNHNETASEMQKAAPAQKTAMSHGQMQDETEDHATPMTAEAPKSWSARSLDWVGRVHPFAVHFPIALFPVAWLALILARRRGDTIDVIRSLIVVAGVTAAGAALLGWMNAGLAPDPDWIHAWHRWLGTGLGLIGAAAAIWTWRRGASVDSRLMVWTLGGTTLLLLIQGWLGGALIHGVDHMNW